VFAGFAVPGIGSKTIVSAKLLLYAGVVEI
jgi:hypothetical protein